MIMQRFTTISMLLSTTLLLLSATTPVSAKKSPQALRAEFVKAMDEATGRTNIQQNNKETFFSRLAQLATPANNNPFPDHQPRQLEEYQNYGVNLTQYALKYIGCSNIKTWSDELAAQNNGNNNGYNSVLKTERFVVLRLCPKESCSNYNEYGCLEQFGDYLLPMETYLQIMAETFFTQYAEYCETCYQCMKNYNNNNNNNANNNMNDDGAAAAAGDDAYNNNNGNNNGGQRRLNDDGYWYNWNNNGDDAVAGDDAAAGANDDGYYYNNNNNNQNQNAAGDCQNLNMDVCENYQSACQDYTNLGFDLQEYFECGEFNIGESVGYMGPHCQSDGKTISMGIFSDENCYEFSADLKDMSNYVQVSESDLEAYYSDNCISCLASVSYNRVVVLTFIHTSMIDFPHMCSSVF
jgi:hypothetical protein